MSRRSLAWVLATLPVLAGCVHFTHKSPDDCAWRPSDEVPEQSKQCVYVFLFDTYNPLHSGELAGVRDYVHHLGFGKTYYGWPHHMDHFLTELQTVHAERPNALFAVIGYGSAAVAAREFAAAAADMGIVVDVSIYLEPQGIEPWDESDGALSNFVLRAADLGPPDAAHGHAKSSSVTRHPFALEVIERELTLMAMGIPPPPRSRPLRVMLVPPMPAPRETILIPKELPPEWQFLRPRHPWDPIPPAPRHGGETLPYPRKLPDLPPPHEVK
ncbi:MAG TPA: hypothetical protein VKD71_16095 [Gemmataceae bacterium]|nr:hypothetical protein [Gemmataceae bacterium]